MIIPKVALKLSQIGLYGFSSAGGAIINTLVAVHTIVFDKELSQFGIGQSDKQRMMNALQTGAILLDCPLKSIYEVMEFRGKNVQFKIIASQYEQNKMRPVDQLSRLQGMSRTIFLHIQNPDDILSDPVDVLSDRRFQETLVY